MEMRWTVLTIDELKAYKAKAKRQRDNWKRRAEVYRIVLEDIAAGPCCGCCDDDGPQCDVGRAKDALRTANAERAWMGSGRGTTPNARNQGQTPQGETNE